MPNQQLLDYIRSGLQQGVSKESLKNEVLAAGWQESQAEEAFSSIKADQGQSRKVSQESWQPQADSEPAGGAYVAEGDGEKAAEPPKKKRGIFIVAVLLILIITSLVVGAGVLVAYGKIPIEDRKLKHKISEIVFSIPFIPKTPEYVLGKSVLAHKEVSSARVELSIANDSKSIANVFGNQGSDLSVKGSFDSADRKRPKASFKVEWAGELDMDFRIKDKNLYFRLNKIPKIVTSLFLAMARDGSDAVSDSLLGVWVHYELSELETEARKALEESKEEDEIFDEAYRELIERLYSEKILPNIEMTSGEVDGFKTHKLHLDLSGELIDQIYKKIGQLEKERRGASLDIEEKGPRPSEVIKKFTIDLWIDSQSYYLRQGNLQMKVDSGVYSRSSDRSGSIYGSLVPSLVNEEVDVVMSLKLEKIGEPVEVLLPKEYMSVEEFMAEALKLLGVNRARNSLEFANAKAYVDQASLIARIIYQEKKQYPGSLEELVQAQGLDAAILDQFSRYKVRYRASADGQNLVIYSMVKNSENPNKAYHVAVHRGEEINAGNYSASELVGELKSLGMEADPELLLLFSPLSPGISLQSL